MESLKNLEDVCKPDVRQKLFVRPDAESPSGFRERTLEDFHRAAESICLHEGVPERVRDHFQAARHLIVYSWFYYPFNVIAELCAYTSVEYALRHKTKDAKTPLSALLANAVKSGWIHDSGFSIPRRKREAMQRFNEGLPEFLQTPTPPLAQEYCAVLQKTLPKLRNWLAHGDSMLHEQGARTVRNCAELSNQLFPKPPS